MTDFRAPNLYRARRVVVLVVRYQSILTAVGAPWQKQPDLVRVSPPSFS